MNYKNIIEKVLEEYQENKNISRLSKIYSIHRSTITYWIKKKSHVREVIDQDFINNLISKNNKDYSFILGLYLGDGCISNNKKSYKLRISQDEKYKKIIDTIQESIFNFFGKNSRLIKSKGCYQITLCDKYLPFYFPQHGIGHKHERPIKLNEFQLKNIDHANLLKGLWMSDGSRYFAIQGKYKYERYNFTNKSLDIINIFENSLSFFGIKYKKRLKPNNIWIIEVQTSKDVKKIKKLVGIKE